MAAINTAPATGSPSAITRFILSFMSPSSTTCPTKSFWSRLAAPDEPGPAKKSRADWKRDILSNPAPAGLWSLGFRLQIKELFVWLFERRWENVSSLVYTVGDIFKQATLPFHWRETSSSCCNTDGAAIVVSANFREGS